ncbi:PREDICTED: uncharacterized protein LOC104820345 isoform X2 [Tarenaya hassleriana]|uniref:uncharacterized protein LOC104820345 isoform X2 n=1 Tax=Tarenaya hassleriana TaxID=28532 RepID=UPI00053C7BB2|nr:PREDICTED: uncharacterized protein LOC104820345 isoform X2 [Tarenaya hassleriana]
MAIVTGDRYLDKLVQFLEEQAESLIEETKVLKLNPAGLHYVHLRLEALHELERMLSGAPVDYLRAYVSDLGDFRALEQLRRILRLLTSLKVVSTLPPPMRDPTPLSLLPFGRLKILELRGCDLSTSAAKGLLELRHTLEKIICHNSTDALRHVFASRIAEIKDSAQWNKLAFVSCACNRLLLMDESLQLLPVVESLDLSRNKFTKVDSLRRCTKLKHLDLGFNNLRTISHLSEVSCRIVKLVLRNNGLTTLRGIENLKSLEGLDVSCNIISNFSELEFLGSLSVLKDLWLEGNPLCCSRWYRAHVFSYFASPNDLKLDGKLIGTREFWKRQIIVARKHRQPASYGFYSPARDDAEDEGSGNRKKKKVCRLASIDSEEESTYISSDQESLSGDLETQSKEENAKSDNESDIFDLIKKVEHLKKERSVLWLREFKEWMDHSSEGFSDVSNDNWGIDWEKRHYSKIRKSLGHHGETSRYAFGSVRDSRDKIKTESLEENCSCVDQPIGIHDVKCVNGTEIRKTVGDVSSLGTLNTYLNRKHQKFLHEEMGTVSVEPNELHPETSATQKPTGNGNMSTLESIQDMAGSLLSSTFLGSPPHYRKDVLHRRHNLVEEILQLSADSYSVASSDSTSSCSEDEFYDSEQSNPEEGQLANQEFLNSTGEQPLSGVSKDYVNRLGEEDAGSAQKGTFSSYSQAEDNISIVKTWRTDESSKAEATNFHSGFHNVDLASCINQIDSWFEKRKSRRKLRKRVVSLLEEDSVVTNGETSKKSEVNISGSDKDESISDHLQESSLATALNCSNSDKRFLGAEQSLEEKDDLVDDYFKMKLSDSSIQETCQLYLHCDCILERDSTYELREVMLLWSGPDKLYVLLVDISIDSPESSLRLLSSLKIEDIQNVSVGLGLQVVRLHFREDTKYIFITKSIEKTTTLLTIVQVFDSQGVDISIGSLEHVQVELFEKEICGGLNLNIFQYNVLHFQSSTLGGVWLLRSIFVAGRHLFICIEDFTQLSSLSVNAASAPYFSLDSCCSISDVSEMVVMESKRRSSCLELKIKQRHTRQKSEADSVIWKLKWFNAEDALKFVALLKALHQDLTEEPLLIRQLG